MVEFVKKQQEKLEQKAFELTKKKDELLQKINNTKTSLATKIESIKSEFKIKNEKIEKEFIQKKSSLDFSLKKIKLIEKEFKTKIKENNEELSKKIAKIKSEFSNKIISLENDFKKLNQSITSIQHDIRIMECEIKYFQSEKFINEQEIEKLHIKNREITKKRNVLEKEKNKKIKNIFFKIISLGFYNRKKSISNQINKLNLKMADNDLLIGLKLWKIEKIETKNQTSINELVTNANSEIQPSTSGYKPKASQI